MNPKNIIIIGASGGIGRSLVQQLRSVGATLFLNARKEQELQEFAHANGQQCLAGDISNPEIAKQVFDAAANSLGELHGIVNLAGSIVLKPAHLTSSADWESVIAQNLTTAFHCIRFGIPHLSEGGSIVLMSSAAGRQGLANHEAIAAAKAGVIGLTKSAAATYANKGIRVNCVAPGLVRTGLSERITSNPSAEKASLSLHPLKRLGEPDDIAPLIAFLLGNDSSWMTGQVLGVDGGLADLKTLVS